MNDGPAPGTSTRRYVAAIADLLARPLPDEGFLLLKLHESRDFSSADPDADWAELMRVSGEFQAELRDLAAALDERWGPHGEMSMEEYAFLDPDAESPGDENSHGGDANSSEGDANSRGEEANSRRENGDFPPLFRELARQGWFGDLLHWRAGDRVVAESVGHEDQEEPVVLFAAVARASGAGALGVDLGPRAHLG